MSVISSKVDIVPETWTLRETLHDQGVVQYQKVFSVRSGSSSFCSEHYNIVQREGIRDNKFTGSSETRL